MKERERQKLSRHKLARAADCPDNMVYMFESGRRTYWPKVAAFIRVLAPKAPRPWVIQSTKAMWGALEQAVWQTEQEPAERMALVGELLALAMRPRSSGDRAADLRRWLFGVLREPEQAQAIDPELERRAA